MESKFAFSEKLWMKTLHPYIVSKFAFLEKFWVKTLHPYMELKMRFWKNRDVAGKLECIEKKAGKYTGYAERLQS
jgi:hypothetical protein